MREALLESSSMPKPGRLQNQVFVQRTRHGRLSGGDMHGRVDAVVTRDELGIEGGTERGDLDQFGDAAAPFGVSLDDASARRKRCSSQRP